MLPAASFALLLASAASAQHPCYDIGSQLVPAAVTASPTLLGCAAAPAWPSWRLFTPEHRGQCPRKGFNPGDARALPFRGSAFDAVSRQVSGAGTSGRR